MHAATLATLMSSASVEWATPPDLFGELDAEFHFDLDPCATPENAKCPTFYTREQDGLAQPWAPATVFVNPPCGRNLIGPWIQKAWEESRRGALVVLLLPARTDTAWFHDYVNGKAEVRFLRGRVRFGGATSGAPFPSMIVVFRPKGDRT